MTCISALTPASCLRVSFQNERKSSVHECGGRVSVTADVVDTVRELLYMGARAALWCENAGPIARSLKIFNKLGKSVMATILQTQLRQFVINIAITWYVVNE